MSRRDGECVAFLQWALPRLRMRWAGFRRVRGQVCKRIFRRVAELGLPDLDAYRAHLEGDAAEWGRLDACCRITISRFYRDRGVWDAIGEKLLPSLLALADDGVFRCWHVGCASGEEPYTLALVWGRKLAGVATPSLRILATDADEALLDRARAGIYEPSSLRDLPHELHGAFDPTADGRLRLTTAGQDSIEFVCQDVRVAWPADAFQLIFCRNSVFTYCDGEVQAAVLDALTRRLVPGGALVIGVHESLPQRRGALKALGGKLGIYSCPRSGLP